MEDSWPMRALDTMYIVIPRQEPTELASSNPHDIPKGVTVQISVDSTGFIFAKPIRPFRVGPRIVSALVATAAHCVMDVLTKTFRRNLFPASLEFYSSISDQVFCVPLLHYLNETEILSTATTGSNYMCSNDLALLLLTGPVDIAQLTAYDIAESVQENSRCVIAGYPGLISNSHIFPGAEACDTSVVEEEIRRIFHNFCERVNSFGSVSNATENLTEIRCSTTTGMSGAPLLIKNANNYEIAGIYVGGPPLPLQYEALRIAQNVYQTGVHDPNQLNTLREICTHVYKGDVAIFNFIEILNISLTSYAKYKNHGILEVIENTVSGLSKGVVSTHPALSEGNLDFYFNVALPVTHPSFIHAIMVRNKFRGIDRDYVSVDELIEFLLK